MGLADSVGRIKGVEELSCTEQHVWTELAEAEAEAESRCGCCLGQVASGCLLCSRNGPNGPRVRPAFLFFICIAVGRI